jgi:hypothetical protein
MESAAMFQTLDEQIERTESGHPTTREWLVRFAGIAIVSVVLFGGLFLVIVALE